MKKYYFLFLSALLFSGKVIAASVPPIITDIGNANPGSTYFGTPRVSVCNGDLVTVLGTNFDPTNNTLQINGIPITPITQSTTLISFTLPGFSGSGSAYSGIIDVSNANGSCSSPYSLSVEICPGFDINTITGIYPGTSVKISGNDLASITDISLENPKPLSLGFNVNNGEIDLIIPSYAPTGPNRLLLTQNTSPDIIDYVAPSYAFDIIPLPTIDVGTLQSTYASQASFNLDYTVNQSFNPGNQFTVEISDGSGVFSGNYIGNIFSQNSGTIAISLPVGDNFTNYKFRINSSDPVTQSAESAPFTILPPPVPTITGFSPASGLPLSFITVTGENLQNISSVDIGGINEEFTIVSSVNIIIKVNTLYDNTTSFSGIINLYEIETPYSSADPFTIVPAPLPVINSFSPASGFPGTQITIIGSNLEYTTNVKLPNPTPPGISFQIISTNVLIATIDSLFIPYGTFNNNIKVFNSGNGASYAQSAVPFTLLPFNIPTITGFSPAVAYPGDNVTIDGLSFEVVRNVEIPSYYTATIISKSSNRIVASVSPLISGTLTPDFIKIGHGQLSQYDAYSSAPITILGLDGQIEAIDINKASFTTDESIIFTITTSGKFSSNNTFIAEISDEFGAFPSKKQATIISDPIGSISGTTGVIQSFTLYLPFTVAYLPTSANYKVRVSSSLPSLKYAYASGIQILRIPRISGFYPLSGQKGTIVTLTGYLFNNSSISGIEFNGVSAAYTIPNDTLIYVTVPAGNPNGALRIAYGSGAYAVAPYNFGTSVTNIKVDSLLISTANSSAALIDSIGGTLQLSATIFPSDASDKRIRWMVSDTLLATIDSTGLLKARLNGQVTVTASSLSNPNVSGVLEVSLIHQYIAVTGMTISGEDSLNIVALAVEDLPINAWFVPDTATNQKYKLTILQSQPFVTERDTIEHIISLNKNLQENGIITVIGTSLDNPTVSGVWVVSVIGQVIETSEAILQRNTPNVTTAGVKQLNPCEGTLELFIDGTKYIGFQWFYVTNNDTAIVVGANKPSFAPVIKGDYYIIAYDNEYNYAYHSFTVTVSGASIPLVTALGVPDTMLVASPSLNYQWFVGDKLIKDATQQSLRVWYNGSYTVLTSDENKCKSPSNPYKIDRPDFVDIARSGLLSTDSTIENYGKLKGGTVRIYPNPANSDFTLEYFSTSARHLLVTIFNSFGLEISNKRIEYVNNPLRNIHFNTENIPEGLYNIRIIDGENIFYKKVLINK